MRILGGVVKYPFVFLFSCLMLTIISLSLRYVYGGDRISAGEVIKIAHEWAMEECWGK